MHVKVKLVGIYMFRDGSGGGGGGGGGGGVRVRDRNPPTSDHTPCLYVEPTDSVGTSNREVAKKCL